MNVGDLVLVHPARGHACIVVELEAPKMAGCDMRDCVVIWDSQLNCAIPMGKEWLEVISEAK